MTSPEASQVSVRHDEPALEATVIASFPEVTSPASSPPHSPGAPDDPLSLLEEDDMDIGQDNLYSSDIFNIEQDRDKRGRLIKPRRQGTPPRSPSPNLQTPTASSLSSERGQLPPVSSSLARSATAPTLFRPSSRQIFATTPSRIGRGKGNKFDAVNDKLVPAKNPTFIDGANQVNESLSMKQMWKAWKAKYETEVRKEHIASKPATEVLCQRCERFIQTGNFVNHKLKYDDYCTSMHSFIKYRKHCGISSTPVFQISRFTKVSLDTTFIWFIAVIK